MTHHNLRLKCCTTLAPSYSAPIFSAATPEHVLRAQRCVENVLERIHREGGPSFSRPMLGYAEKAIYDFLLMHHQCEYVLCDDVDETIYPPFGPPMTLNMSSKIRAQQAINKEHKMSKKTHDEIQELLGKIKPELIDIKELDYLMTIKMGAEKSVNVLEQLYEKQRRRESVTIEVRDLQGYMEQMGFDQAEVEVYGIQGTLTDVSTYRRVTFYVCVNGKIYGMEPHNPVIIFGGSLA